MRSPRLGARLAVALGAGAISFGGVSATAYAGVLPAGLQDLAHTTVGAPAADHGKSADHRKPADSTAKTAVGPDVKGHAAFGLCTSSPHVLASGKAADRSVAFRNLTAAAGEPSGITAYCATVPYPGPSVTGKSATSSTGQSARHPAGKPAIPPTGQSAMNPTGKPATHSTGKPGTHVTGKPSSVPVHHAGGSAVSHDPDRGATRRVEIFLGRGGGRISVERESARYAAAPTMKPVEATMRRIASAAGPGIRAVRLATGRSRIERTGWEVRCQPPQSEQQ